MHKLLLAVTGIALIAGCREAANQGADNAAAEPGANNAATSTSASANSAAVALPTQPVSGEAATRLMKDRHENYERIGDAMKLASRELKSDNPNLVKVRGAADRIAQLAAQVPSWFPPGTGPDVGKTEAKAEIWQKPDDFAAKTRDFIGAARAFQGAVQSTDLTAMRSAHAALGKTCKACHDPYREEH